MHPGFCLDEEVEAFDPRSRAALAYAPVCGLSDPLLAEFFSSNLLTETEVWMPGLLSVWQPLQLRPQAQHRRVCPAASCIAAQGVMRQQFSFAVRPYPALEPHLMFCPVHPPALQDPALAALAQTVAAAEPAGLSAKIGFGGCTCGCRVAEGCWSDKQNHALRQPAAVRYWPLQHFLPASCPCPLAAASQLAMDGLQRTIFDARWCEACEVMQQQGFHIGADDGEGWLWVSFPKRLLCLPC